MRCSDLLGERSAGHHSIAVQRGESIVMLFKLQVPVHWFFEFISVGLVGPIQQSETRMEIGTLTGTVNRKTLLTLGLRLKPLSVECIRSLYSTS